ncbi:GNAT family N-acetyltransferase [Streptomyces sp. NBC_00286]|uniref:GNAT family N-acetyltransferase n=1 Tax=Streptomyces sp. NBC_00286 TaxID=2975701 RepID=UPI002E287838|nr:GNAT family N-acetyltransferase [Streptomyces sp. NBC_00286]
MSAVAAQSGAGTLRAELCTDEREFTALAPAWERLYRKCSTATPFQSHAWLHSWWMSYGTPGRLRLTLVRDNDGELRAAAPLMRTGGPLPRLVPLGGAISDYSDVLLDDEHTASAATTLTQTLWSAARTALIDIREVRPGSAVEQVYAHWPGPRLQTPDSVCLELPASPLNELLTRMPPGRARRVQSKIRKLTELGIEHRFVHPEEVPSTIRTLLDLHRLQWQNRKVTPEHLKPRFHDHLTRSLVPLVRSGDAVVTEFRAGTDVLAVDVTLLARRLAGNYLYGAHPRLREWKADIATMLLHACASRVPQADRQVLSLLRGTEPYKFRWRPDTVVNQRLLLARRRTAPLLSAVACEAYARSRARELVRGRKGTVTN